MPGRLAAWYRGVVAAMARGWGLVRLHPKCRLRLAAINGVNLRTGELSSTLSLRVTNVGREPVVVSGIALRHVGSTKESYLPARNLPKRLEPNDSVIEVFDCPGTLPTDAVALYEYDTSGVEWELPKKQLKELLRHQISGSDVGDKSRSH